MALSPPPSSPASFPLDSSTMPNPALTQPNHSSHDPEYFTLDSSTTPTQPQPQPTPTHSTHETATTQYIHLPTQTLAYRIITSTKPTFHPPKPLIMIQHFRGNMDLWNPTLINSLSHHRPIYLFDMPGTGQSTGLLATTPSIWARHIEMFLEALGLWDIDLLGFSMGGLACQYLHSIAPGRIRRLVIVASRISRFEGTVDGDEMLIASLSSASTSERVFKTAWMKGFFNTTTSGDEIAEAAWSRMTRRKEHHATLLHLAKPHPLHPSPFVGGDTTLHRKGAAKTHPHQRLSEFIMPVLVACGDEDRLIPTVNSIETARFLPNAHLFIFQLAGHGVMWVHTEGFANVVDGFLRREEGEIRRWLNKVRVGV